ncbi:MAG TPA: sulfotransferase [Myxococcota bacterium]|nr:sulfotransferase [Myxococcota bacterium]
MSTPIARFIVGTGRCGSTLLSRMLAEHPDVCSIFEFFTGLDWGRRFAGGSVPATDFAELISRPQPMIDAVLRRGYSVEEVTYPFGRGRFARGDTMPWILVSMLPRLADDPDRLFEEVVTFAQRLPEQPLREHYRTLFEWLAVRRGRRYWIERSGSSIDYLASLYALFPEARVVHIHRDGREAALSMREHHAYRVPISLMYDAPVASGRRPSELGGIDLTAPPRPDDPISQILASRPPVEAFGRYWSDQVIRGTDALAHADPARFLAVHFEDLVAKPKDVVRVIAAFLGLEGGGGWLARSAGLVRGIPAPRFAELTESERAALDAASRPGMIRLGRA